MAIDVNKLNKKELHELVRTASNRLQAIDQEKIAKVKGKLEALLKAEGLTFGQVYGRARGGRKTRLLPPKYRNPSGEETWSGHGKRPRWFVAALESGKRATDLLAG